MKIKVVSDLHLEFSDVNVTNNDNNDIDVLVLSGDIMIAEKLPKPNSEYGQRFRDFLKRCSLEFQDVIYIAGNHEFYSSGKFYKSVDELRDYCSTNFNNVHFLERDAKIINDVVFVGGTLWTDMNKGDPLTMHAVKDLMMDYNAIKNDHRGFIPLKPIDTVDRHRMTRDYIMHVADEHKDKKIVVCTHHAPSSLSIHPMYAHDALMNGAYFSNLEEYILDRPQIKLWTHGHMHNPFDYMVGETRVVCNPRGYRQEYGFSEDTNWNPDLEIEV